MMLRSDIFDLENKERIKVPAMITELALAHDFITPAIVMAAIHSGKIPERPKGYLRGKPKDDYAALCLEFLHEIERSIEPQKPTDTITKPLPTETPVEPVKTSTDAITEPLPTETPQVEPQPPRLSFPEAGSYPATKYPPIEKPKSSRSIPAPDGMVRLTVNIPKELHTSLRITALTLGKTVTDMVNEWVKMVLRE
jgi:hypothetical protein